jgi:hypothetical protein
MGTLERFTKKKNRVFWALVPLAGAFAFTLGLVGGGDRAAIGAAPSAIPCPALAVAVLANTGQSIHNANSMVQGDVRSAHGIVHNGGTISGTQTTNSPAGLAQVPVPAGATNLGVFLLGSGQSRNLTAGNYVASSFTLNSNSTLTVSGGAVQIWVTGALVIGGRANFNGTPGNLAFLINSNADAHVNSGGTLFGFIYAPTANVLVDSVVHGSVTGSNTTLNSGGQVIFDAGSKCPVCTPPLVDCNGTCKDLTSDPNNCGACGNVCPGGDSCINSVCTPPGACAPANSLTTLITGTTVAAYVPKGSWSEVAATNTGVKLVGLEGSVTATTIPTANPVNSCAGNSATGKVVCSSNLNDVYIITGSTVTSTLTDGATNTQQFSGGSCRTCGVTVDAVHNRAVLTMGLATGGGYQLLDLAASTFGTPISAGAGVLTAEDILIDPGRNLILSPNESNVYQAVNVASTPAVFNMTTTGSGGEMDSAAEDCSTGIALSSVEGTGKLFLTNLTGATFSGGTWTGSSQFQTFPEFASFSAGTDGIAVDSGTHLGVVTGEFGGTGFGAIQLPSTTMTGVPSVTDWAAANVPNDPSGATWAMGLDPHTVTVYRSPTSNKAFGVFVNGTRTFLAVVDLQALLAAPRTAGTHNVSPTFDLVSNNVVRFVALP